MKIFSVALLGCALGYASSVEAQPKTEALKIEPDTPNFTVGTSVVPRGHLQSESRITAQQRGPMHEHGFGETLAPYEFPRAQKFALACRLISFRVKGGA